MGWVVLLSFRSVSGWADSGLGRTVESGGGLTI